MMLLGICCVTLIMPANLLFRALFLSTKDENALSFFLMCSFSHELGFAVFLVEAEKTNDICEP